MNKFRNISLIIAYAAFGFLSALSTAFYVPPPQAIRVVAPTEAQIKEQVKSERRHKQVERAIARATAAAREIYRHNGCSDRYSALTGRTAYEFRISPRLLAAVVFVESGCRESARSGRDSIGLLQVNPRIWGHRKELTNPEFNIRLGTTILTSYIKRYGLICGLHRYNGLGNPTDSYAVKVLTTAGYSTDAIQHEREKSGVHATLQENIQNAV
jgi:soluble lytic murein transglycosylase-like protein